MLRMALLGVAAGQRAVAQLRSRHCGGDRRHHLFGKDVLALIEALDVVKDAALLEHAASLQALPRCRQRLLHACVKSASLSGPHFENAREPVYQINFE